MGHILKDVIEATRRLKQAGFKIGYHLCLEFMEVIQKI